MPRRPSPFRVLRQLSPASGVGPAGGCLCNLCHHIFHGVFQGSSRGLSSADLSKACRRWFWPLWRYFWGRGVSGLDTPRLFCPGGHPSLCPLSVSGPASSHIPGGVAGAGGGSEPVLVQELSRWHVYLMAIPAVLLLGAVTSDLASLRGEVFSLARAPVRWTAVGLASLLILSGLTYVLVENFRVDPLWLGLRPWFGTVGVGDRNRAIKTAGYYLRKFTPSESIPLTSGFIHERSLVAQLYFGRRHLPGRTGPRLFLTLGDLQGRGADYVVVFEDGHLLTAAFRQHLSHPVFLQGEVDEVVHFPRL